MCSSPRRSGGLGHGYASAMDGGQADAVFCHVVRHDMASNRSNRIIEATYVRLVGGKTSPVVRMYTCTR